MVDFVAGWSDLTPETSAARHRSQKRTVRGRRSPSGSEPTVCAGSDLALVVDDLSRKGPSSEIKPAPQSPQNLDVGGLSASHFGQTMLSAAPHCAQNFFPGGFSALHLKQNTLTAQQRKVR